MKDEELQQLSKDIRARDSTIRDIADKLMETAEAAEAAASAAHSMDEERKLVLAHLEYLKKDLHQRLESSSIKVTYNLVTNRRGFTCIFLLCVQANKLC